MSLSQVIKKKLIEGAQKTISLKMLSDDIFRTLSSESSKSNRGPRTPFAHIYLSGLLLVLEEIWRSVGLMSDGLACSGLNSTFPKNIKSIT